jgi:hypothetical protein
VRLRYTPRPVLFSLFASLPFLAALLASDPALGQNRLIISQYVDTDSGSEPKGVELWNVFGSAIDFSADNLTVNRYANGSSSATTEFTLTSGTLADGEVVVIGGSVLGAYMSSNAPSVAFFNVSFFWLYSKPCGIRLYSVVIKKTLRPSTRRSSPSRTTS